MVEDGFDDEERGDGDGAYGEENLHEHVDSEKIKGSVSALSAFQMSEALNSCSVLSLGVREV